MDFELVKVLFCTRIFPHVDVVRNEKVNIRTRPNAALTVIAD